VAWLLPGWLYIDFNVYFSLTMEAQMETFANTTNVIAVLWGLVG
jgi:hypothetical protein